ncbi:MAG TPA: hypothetical protein VMW69_02620, partial [Spirochaetia bacterium]|nr:hypothetical protein [Spirochaetia bacterium]
MNPHPHVNAEWFKLDNAATMYPSVASARTTTLYRLAVTLDAPIKVAPLQRALENIVPRFPYYLVEFRAGLFWYYLVKKNRIPKLEADGRSPCMDSPRKRRGRYLFHVRAYRRRISVEFSHMLTDGSGGIAFLRSLLLEYFALLGTSVEVDHDILLPDSPIDPEEYEDAYHKFYNPEIPGPPREKKSFQLPAPLLPVGTYEIITGIVSIDKLKEAASAHGATLTVFLSAVLLHAVQAHYFDLPKRKRRPGKIIRIEVPVNLRNLYPSKSMRNFSLYVTPGIDPRLGRYTFEEIISEVHHFMKVAINERAINQQIARNIRGELHLVVRAIPLFFKNLVIRRIYYTLGESLFSTCLTNLGPVTMPEPIASHIERFEVVSPPSVTNKTNCGIVTYNGRAYITFG